MSASEQHVDVTVIGAGPGGYAAAIRLAQLGCRTMLIEREALGGVCLNWGCIPSKALIHAGKLFEAMRHASEYGIHVAGEITVDLPKLIGWKDQVVGRLTGGIGQLMKANGVTVAYGTARLRDSKTVAVTTNEGVQLTLHCERGVLLATGSRSIEIPGLPFDGELVHGNRSILSLRRIPRHLIVIGGGVIGLELGTFFRKLGSQVTVVELSDQLLPGTDPELVKVVARELKKAKVEVLLRSRAGNLQRHEGGGRLQVETAQGQLELEGDAILVTIGRRPCSADLGLEACGVALDGRGHVVVDHRMQTSVAGIFAIGDLVGPPLLAHKATREGLVAAANLAGRDESYDVRAMPAAIFTDPEIATVGLSEQDACAAGFETETGMFPFAASGRALSTGESVGFVKLVSDRSSGAILGAGIVGPEASNLIAEAALAIELGATAADLAMTVHPHPTLSEALMEAADDLLGHPIHTAPKRQ